MARIRDFAFTEGSVMATTFACDMPEHVSGDLLLLFVNCDGTVLFNSTPSGWSDPPGNSANLAGSGHSSRVWYKVAASSSETVSVTMTAAETYTATVMSIKDFDSGDIFNVNCTKRTADDATNPYAGSAITTDENNCLIISFLSTDGGQGPICEPPWTNLINGDAGANSGGLAYYVQKTAGTVAANSWRGQTNDNTTAWTFAINDSGSLASLDPYLQPGNTTGKLIEHGYWITGGANNAWGNSYPTALSLASIGTKTAVWDAAAVTYDSGLNPYWGVCYCTPAASTNGSAVGGSQVNFGTAQDLTGGILFYNYFFATPRDYVDCSTPTDSGAAGMLLVLADASNNYSAWSMGAKNTVTMKPDGYNITCLQADQTEDTRYASSGNLSESAVTYALTLAQGRYGAVAFRWSHMCIGYEQPIAGGTASEPLNFNDLDFLLNRSLGAQRVMLREGSAATFLLPLRFGGTDPIHIVVSLRTLQYRTQSDGLDYLDWHVDDGAVGFEFDGQAGDTISFVGCVFTAGSPYYWRFSADHSGSANTDFTGCTVVNALVTLRSTVALETVTFTDCPSFTQNAAALDNCTMNNSKITSASLADMDNITNCSFNSSGTGHAIEVGGSASTITFTGNTFDGYAASNGSTGNEAIYVNIATGTVTINISGGDTPSIRTAGATVVVNNSVTLQLTGLVTGSDIVILNAGTTTERVNVDANAGTTYDFSYSYAASDYVDICVYKQGYVPYTVRNYLLGASSSSLPIAQVADRNFSA